MNAPTDPVEVALLAQAAEAQHRIDHCHERVACPKCGMPVGTRCRRIRRTGTSYSAAPADVPLRHPHAERWAQVQPPR